MRRYYSFLKFPIMLLLLVYMMCDMSGADERSRNRYYFATKDRSAAVHHINESMSIVRSTEDIDSATLLLPSQKINHNIASAVCDDSVTVMLMTASLTPQEIRHFVDEVINLSTQLHFSPHSRDVAATLSAPSPQEVYIRITLSCEHRIPITNAIAELPDVLYIERYLEVHSLNAFAVGVCQTGNSQHLFTTAANLTGSNHIIGIADTGLDTKSCYFYDDEQVTTSSVGSHRKIAIYLPYMNQVDEDGHGTHVVGSAVGKCSNEKSSKSDYDGVLSDGRVAFMDIGYSNSAGAAVLNIPPNINSELYQQLYNFGARVMSMSWGAETNEYTLNARNTDAFMYNNKDALVFVAAGNSGDEGSGTVNSPASAKNAVTVGASMNSHDSFEQIINNIPPNYNEDSVAWFSSRGPTADGRVKPDVMAPGLYITSANAKMNSKSEHCGTRSSEGTSSSTPLAAAHAILIRQYFLDGYYPTGVKSDNRINPSGALLKAMIVASAQEMKYVLDGNNAATPTVKGDNIQGYGRIQLDRVLTFENNTGLFVMGAADASSPYYVVLSSNQQHQYNFTTVTTGDVAVVLAYTDYPASTFSSNALINDLDLLVSNGTNEWIPITAAPGATDTKNNLEVIVIRNATRDTLYTITVSSKTLSFDQEYAVVAVGNITPLTYTSPKPTSNSTPIGLSYRAKAAIAALCSLSLLVVCCMFWLGAYSYSEEHESGKHMSGNFGTTFQRARSMLSRAGSEFFDIEAPANREATSFSKQESTSDASVAVEGNGTWKALKRVEKSFLRGIEVAEVAIAQPIEKLTFQEVVRTPRKSKKDKDRSDKRKSKSPPPKEAPVLQSPPTPAEVKDRNIGASSEAAAEYEAMKLKFDSMSKKIRTQTTEKHVEPRLSRSSDVHDDARRNSTDSHDVSHRRSESDGVPTSQRSDVSITSTLTASSRHSRRSTNGSVTNADVLRHLEASDEATPQFLNTGAEQQIDASRRSRRHTDGSTKLSIPPEVSIPTEASNAGRTKVSPGSISSKSSKHRHSADERVSIATVPTIPRTGIYNNDSKPTKRTPRSSRESSHELHTPPLHPTVSTSLSESSTPPISHNIKSKFAKSPTESVSTRPARRVSNNSQRPGRETNRRFSHE